MIEVEIFTRPGCHLCDEMKDTLERAASRLAVRLTETNVETDPELERLYGHLVPVLFVNGERAFELRATERELRLRLERA